jgi:hypothetical protein
LGAEGREFESRHADHLKEEAMKKRKLSIQLQVLPPRNPVAAMAKVRNAGSHAKSERTLRRKAKFEMKMMRAEGVARGDSSVPASPVVCESASITCQITRCR